MNTNVGNQPPPSIYDLCPIRTLYCVRYTLLYQRWYAILIPPSISIRCCRPTGFAEPDIREDLSGEDLRRKVVILAREIGMDINLEDVEVRYIRIFFFWIFLIIVNPFQILLSSPEQRHHSPKSLYFTAKFYIATAAMIPTSLTTYPPTYWP